MDNIVFFIISILLEIFLPVFLGLYLAKRFSVPWKAFFVGIFSFIVVQFFHAPVVAFTQPAFGSLENNFSLAVFALYLGILAGVFEEVGRYIVYKKVFPWQKLEVTKENAIMFGAGWGGIESILVGLLVLSTMVAYIYAAPLTPENKRELNASGTLTGEQLDYIIRQNELLLNLKPLDILAGAFERMMTITLHIIFSILVLFALKKRVYLWIAIAYHAMLDFLAIFIGQSYGVWWAELAIFALVLPGLYFIAKLK